MSTSSLLAAPRREHRAGVAPMIEGAGLGFLVGAGLGMALPVILLVESVVAGGSGSGPWWEELGPWALILLFAGFVGGCYGALVGFVGGVGGVVAPRRGLRRRVAVTVAVLLVGGVTVVVLSVGSVGDLWRSPLGLYLPVMGIAAWLVAPYVDGEGRRTR